MDNGVMEKEKDKEECLGKKEESFWAEEGCLKWSELVLNSWREMELWKRQGGNEKEENKGLCWGLWMVSLRLKFKA